MTKNIIILYWNNGVTNLKQTKLEQTIEKKVCEMLNYALIRLVKPDIEVDKVAALDERAINTIKQKYGIEGIILDLDDTLRKDMKKIPECNQKWIDQVKKQLKVIVVSNGIDKDAEDFFKLKGIDYIGFAHKPLKRNFLLACRKMNLTPEQVMVIGDDLFCDVYGGKRNGMTSVWVKKVDDESR